MLMKWLKDFKVKLTNTVFPWIWGYWIFSFCVEFQERHLGCLYAEHFNSILVRFSFGVASYDFLYPINNFQGRFFPKIKFI